MQRRACAEIQHRKRVNVKTRIRLTHSQTLLLLQDRSSMHPQSVVGRTRGLLAWQRASLHPASTRNNDSDSDSGDKRCSGEVLHTLDPKQHLLQVACPAYRLSFINSWTMTKQEHRRRGTSFRGVRCPHAA